MLTEDRRYSQKLIEHGDAWADREGADAAEGEIAGTAMKLARKIDGLGDVTRSEISGSTPSYFQLLLVFANGLEVRIYTKMIVNVSVLGRPFNQWPSKMSHRQAGGVFKNASEAEIKKLVVTAAPAAEGVIR